MTGEHHHHVNISKEEQDFQPSSIDTKSKVILTLIFIIVGTLVVTFEQLILMGTFTLFLMIIYKVNIKSLLLKSALPFPLILSLSLLAYFSDLGDNTLSFGQFSIQYLDWQITLFFFLRSLIIIFGAISLVESEDSFFEVIYAIDELGLPDTLVSLLLIMYRSSLDLFEEARRMINVRYSRSTHKRWGVNLYTYRILGYMVGNVIVRSFLKKDLRKDALYSRNFKGTLYHKPKPFMFNGILLLWLGMIGLIIILSSVNLEFVGLGTR